MGKIGIMGGTFDPIHNGHLLIGRQAYREYHLDQIWYMPSRQPPHKTDHLITDISQRCEMTKLAISPYPYFLFSDFEVQRKGYSYTAQTLQLLKEVYPEHKFYFIIGADSLFDIEKWYHPEAVMSQATIIVAERIYEDTSKTMAFQIQYLEQKYLAKFLTLHCREINISSAELREMVSHGKSLIKYVPKLVSEYINTSHLYRE